MGLATVLNDRSRRASVLNFTFSYAAPEVLLGDQLTLKVISRRPGYVAGCCDSYCICRERRPSHMH